MKGFQKDTGSNILFLGFNDGSISETSKKPREGFEEVVRIDRTTKEPYSIYIQRYRSVEAYVTNIEWYDRNYNERRYMGWKIHLKTDKGDEAVLDMPFESMVCKRFMKLAENIDFTKPVEFRAWKDGKNTAFMVAQDGQSVPQFYSKDHNMKSEENPDGCPPPVQSAITQKWDWTAQTEYLFTKMQTVVIPRVKAAAADLQLGTSGGSGFGEREESAAEGPPLDDSDIPF